MKLAVIGAGNGGAAAAVELTIAGHKVALYGRSADTIAPFAQDGIRYMGVFGEGVVRPALLSSRIAEVINGAEASRMLRSRARCTVPDGMLRAPSSSIRATPAARSNSRPRTARRPPRRRRSPNSRRWPTSRASRRRTPSTSPAAQNRSAPPQCRALGTLCDLPARYFPAPMTAAT
jgi:hypothetical protein